MDRWNLLLRLCACLVISCSMASEPRIVGDRVQGRGVAVSRGESGMVVTAAHVLLANDQWELLGSDGRVWAVEAIEFAPDRDLAILDLAETPSDVSPFPVSRVRAAGSRVRYHGKTGVLQSAGRGIVAISGDPIRPGESGGGVEDSAGSVFAVLRGFRAEAPRELEAVRFDDYVRSPEARIRLGEFFAWQSEYRSLQRINSQLSALGELYGDALQQAAIVFLKQFFIPRHTAVAVLDELAERELAEICRAAAYLGLRPDGLPYARAINYSSAEWEALERKYGPPAFAAGDREHWGIRLWRLDGRELWAGFCERGAFPGRILLSFQPF